MNKDLQAMIELQQIDLKIIESERRIQSVPSQLEEVDLTIEKASEQLLALKNQLAEKQKLRRQDDLEIESLRARLAKYKDQLMSVKNNREYTAMLKEIESCEGEIKKVEDRLLESMVAADSLLQGIAEAQQRFRVEEEKLLEQRRELENLANNHQNAHQDLLSCQSEVEGRLNRQWLAEYRKISEKRNGIGLAEAKDGCCMVCRVRMRAQIYTDIRKGDTLRHCDSCGRILYRLTPPKPPSARKSSPPEKAAAAEEIADLAENA